MAQRAVTEYDTSIRVACAVFSISETCYRYQPKLNDENAEIADWLLRLTQTYKRWGFGLCFFTCIIPRATPGITKGSIEFTRSWS